MEIIGVSLQIGGGRQLVDFSSSPVVHISWRNSHAKHLKETFIAHTANYSYSFITASILFFLGDRSNTIHV